MGELKKHKKQQKNMIADIHHAWPWLTSFAELRRKAFSDMDQADGKGEEGKT